MHTPSYQVINITSDPPPTGARLYDIDKTRLIDKIVYTRIMGYNLPLDIT